MCFPLSVGQVVTRSIVALGLAAGVLGCGRGSGEAGEVEPEIYYDRQTPVALSISNNHWLDIVVFVFHDGELSRVGTVTAATNGSFTLAPWMLGQSRTIRLLADPVGSEGWIRSESIHVQPGQSVEWRLESQLSRSSVMVY